MREAGLIPGIPQWLFNIFPSKMGAHKPGLVEMQQTSGVSVWFLLTGDVPSKSITLHKLQIKQITWASSVVLLPVALCL